MHTAKISRGSLAALVLGLALSSAGCFGVVRLPKAPPFPKALSQDAIQVAIRARVKQIEPKLWGTLMAQWGVQKLSGRLFLRLTLQEAAIQRCVYRRSELMARPSATSVQRKLRRKLHRSTIRRTNPQVAGVCDILKQLRWPEYKGRQPLLVDILLSRAPSSTP